MLTVWDFEGREHATDSAEQLAALLQCRDSQGRNSFYITHGNQKHPTLAITVRGNDAYVYFFPNEHDAGAFALSPRTHPDPDGLTTFWISDTESIDVPNRSVVTAAEAAAAAEEFRIAPRRPTTVEWFEL